MSARAAGLARQAKAGDLSLALALRLVLLVLAATSVVTIATNGSQLLLLPADLGDALLWGIRVAGMAIAVLALVTLLRQRKRLVQARGRGADRTLVAFRTAATIMGLLTLLALLNPPARAPAAEGGASSFGLIAVPGFGGGSDGEAIPSRTIGGESEILGSSTLIEPVGEPSGIQVESPLDRILLQRIAVLLLGTLILFALVIRFWPPPWRREGSNETPPTDDTLAPTDIVAGLEASLTEVVDYGGDPRGQITNAYHRLLAALHAAGAHREPHEAPHEYLYRALGPLGVDPRPLHRLTRLYVLAQFNQRPVHDGHRAEAVEALEHSLVDLRTAHYPLAGQEPVPGSVPA